MTREHPDDPKHADQCDDHIDEDEEDPEAEAIRAAAYAEWKLTANDRRDREMAEADGLLAREDSMADRADMIRMSEKDR